MDDWDAETMTSWSCAVEEGGSLGGCMCATDGHLTHKVDSRTVSCRLTPMTCVLKMLQIPIRGAAMVEAGACQSRGSHRVSEGMSSLFAMT